MGGCPLELLPAKAFDHKLRVAGDVNPAIAIIRVTIYNPADFVADHVECFLLVGVETFAASNELLVDDELESLGNAGMACELAIARAAFGEDLVSGLCLLV